MSAKARSLEAAVPYSNADGHERLIAIVCARPGPLESSANHSRKGRERVQHLLGRGSASKPQALPAKVKSSRLLI